MNCHSNFNAMSIHRWIHVSLQMGVEFRIDPVGGSILQADEWTISMEQCEDGHSTKEDNDTLCCKAPGPS